MQHTRIPTLFEHLSRSLLVTGTAALLITAAGLGFFAQRNIGLTTSLADQHASLQRIAASPAYKSEDDLKQGLRELMTDPFRAPLHVQAIDQKGQVVYDSLAGQRRLLDLVVRMGPATPARTLVYPVQSQSGLALHLTGNPLNEIREALENLSVAVGALVALTLMLYFTIRRRMRQAFAPLTAITQRLQKLESGTCDEPPLPAADTHELDRMAASVNHLQTEWVRLQARQMEWMNRIEDLQESERRHIAAELHDELGQHLTALQVDAATLSKLCSGNDQARHIADALQSNSQTLLARVRALLQQLRPGGLDGAEDQTSALKDSIVSLIEEWQGRLGDTRIILELDLPDINLPSRLSTAAFRLVQEGLTNAARHSRASRIEVGISWNALPDERGLQLNIALCDDGIGTDEPPRSLMERTRSQGGQFRVIKPANGGTDIRINLPLYQD